MNTDRVYICYWAYTYKNKLSLSILYTFIFIRIHSNGFPRLTLWNKTILKPDVIQKKKNRIKLKTMNLSEYDYKLYVLNKFISSVTRNYE